MGRRIEEKTSRTAAMTCSCRAASYYEENPCYRSDDHVATLLVPWFVRFMSKSSFLRRPIISRFAPKGVYEYVIARTRYIDRIFTDAVNQGVEQVLIFGAGYDTRSTRLLRDGDSTRVFEVDAEVTQDSKLERFREVGVPVPDNTTYISIDFLKDDPKESLRENGFQTGRRCLFILEGLLMYLDEEAVEKTFQLMYELSDEGSTVVFDYVYASVLRHEGKYYGERELQNNVSSGGEPWTFGFEEGQVGEYLLNRGYSIVEESNSETLEKRFFINHNGALQGRINGTHSIVLAKHI